MRAAFCVVVLAATLAVSAQAQGVTFRVGGDFVAGSYQAAKASTSGLALGGAGLFTLHTTGAVRAYGALRPELTVQTEGGTGFYQEQEVLYYGDDGLPAYGGGVCRNAATGDPAPGACGSNLVRGALSAEVGLRLAAGQGAALFGVGLRGGAGGGLYGAVTGQLASPVYGRLEVGTGHVLIGLGFGRL